MEKEQAKDAVAELKAQVIAKLRNKNYSEEQIFELVADDYFHFAVNNGLSADDVIKGRWIYWNKFGQLCRTNGDLICDDLHHIVQVQRNDVVESTVGQLVLIDTRKRFFFDRDILKETATGNEFEIVRRNSAVSLRCLKSNDESCIGKLYAFKSAGDFEVIGNMSEV